MTHSGSRNEATRAIRDKIWQIMHNEMTATSFFGNIEDYHYFEARRKSIHSCQMVEF